MHLVNLFLAFFYVLPWKVYRRDKNFKIPSIPTTTIKYMSKDYVDKKNVFNQINIFKTIQFYHTGGTTLHKEEF